MIAVHLSNLEGDAAEDEAWRLRADWARYVEEPAKSLGVPAPKLDLVRTPYREFIVPVLNLIEKIKLEYPNRLVAVVIPEIVEAHWWYALLHTRRAARLRSALRARQDAKVIVVDLPWFVRD